MRCHLPLSHTKNFAGRFLTIWFFFASLSIGYGQTKEDTLNNSRLSVQLINLDPTLRTLSFENEDYLKVANNGGNRMTAYYKGDTVYKITIRSGLSYGVSQYEYYLKKSRPFYILETEQGFPKKDSTGAVDRTVLAFNFEGRYYFDDNGRLIEKRIRGRKQLDEDVNDDNKEDSYKNGSDTDIRELLSNADSYLLIIREHLTKMGKP